MPITRLKDFDADKYDEEANRLLELYGSGDKTRAEVDREEFEIIKSQFKNVKKTKPKKKEPKKPKKPTFEEYALLKALNDFENGNDEAFMRDKDLIYDTFTKELDEMLDIMLDDEEDKLIKLSRVYANKINNNFFDVSKLIVKKAEYKKMFRNKTLSKMLEDFEKLGKTTPKTTPKKKQSKGNIMKGRSDIETKGGKRMITTELNIKKGLTPKEKTTLKKSVLIEFDKKIKGSGMRPTIVLSSDSEDERPKRGGRVKPIKTLKDVLKHLLEHIEDLDGEFDEDDYKQSKEIIDILKKVKKAKKRAIPVQSSLSQYLENVEKKKDDERLLKVDKFLNMF